MKRIIVFGLLAAIAIFLIYHIPRQPKANPRSQPATGTLLTRAELSQSTSKPFSLVSTNGLAKGPARATQNSPLQEAGAIDAFAEWAKQFLSGDNSLSIAQGEALAWKRREALFELMETNPKMALESTVPFSWRLELPSNITRHFEQLVDGRGLFHVAVATDFERGKATVHREAEVNGERYQVFTYGKRLSQGTRANIPLHGIALPITSHPVRAAHPGDQWAGKRLVLSPDAIRILEPAESRVREAASAEPVDPLCGVSGQPSDVRGQPLAADMAGDIRHFCGVDHARWVNELWLAADGGSGPPGTYAFNGGQDWTHGHKTVLYIRVNFPDDLTEPISEAGAYNIMNGVNTYYTEISYDMTAMTATVTPLITLPKPKAWYSTSGPGGLQADAREAARKLGYETGNYDRDIITFTSVEGYDFGGLASVGGKGVWLQSTGVGVTSHELGHNYGLWHANFWDAITNSSIIGPGTNFEYGNIFDTMGSGGVAQFNATHKYLLGWIPPAAVHEVKSNGVYRIFPFDVPDRVSGRHYAAKVQKDFQRDYWIEFRQKLVGNPWLQYGVLLNWSPWEQSSGGTHMLDTTPGTPTGSLSREDSSVVIGRTFTDAGAGIHITPLARGMTGTNIWMDVQLNLGQYPGNQSPSLKLEIDSTNVAPGSLVHFHASTSDPENEPLAYTWTFDDLTFSTNNLPWTYKAWPAAGDHIVRCVVSDMKGGVASANGLVTVGSRSGYRVRGRIVDHNGNPVEGVHVNNSATNTSDYIGGYTDSHGTFILVGLTGDVLLNPVKYGYIFTNLTWQNPLTLTSDVVNVDFEATPMTGVNITASSATVAENGGGVQSFVLTRTGDISNTLSVAVYLWGQAALGSDYTLMPTFAAGSNVVEFPADSNTVAITFQAINDGTVEGPENVTLTITEEDEYVILPGGSATLTIQDDDLAARPAVSVVTTSPTVYENGVDTPTFVLSRTGSTPGDLVVNYSVTGTATSGTDYNTPLGVVIIPSGRAGVAVQVPLKDDKIMEGEETLVFNVTPNAAYTVDGGAAQVTLLDEDLLTVTVAPTASALAEPAGTGRFTVKRDGDLTASVLVNYTVGGTATSGADFTPLSGSVIVPAGSTSAEFIVNPLDDVLLEGDESVIITLTTNIAYNIGTPGNAMLRIRDNEKVSVSVTAPDSATSEPGEEMGSFQISRGTVINGSLVVNLAISGTAVGGADYVPLDSVVVIPDGSSAVTLGVIAFDDLHQEPEEQIRLFVLPSTNYNVGTPGSAAVIIEDNDGNSVPAAGFSFSVSSSEENRSPGVSVSLSATSASPITVECVVIGGTAAANDYTLSSAMLTFEPGDRAKSLPLQINNDSTIEPAETIRLALFNPMGATLDGIKIHTYTIVDDDTASVTVAATSASAFETGPANGNFRITRSGTTTGDLLVNFEMTGTASSPSDYAPLGGSVIIPAGATFVDLPVSTVNDSTVEYDETVRITILSAPGGRILAPNSATVTIFDNDPEGLPIVSVTATNQPYAVEGGATGGFVFHRNGAPVGALTVHFTVAGTAGGGADYSALPAMVTIPDGQASISLAVNAVNDSLVEGEETLVLSLSLRDAYRAIYPSSAIVTIQDNDQRIRVDASDFIATEPGLEDKGEFTFTRFGTTNTPVQVLFTVSGTAGNGTDYVALPNSFTIPAGQLSASMVIQPLDDGLVEGPETVTLTVQPNAAYSLETAINGTVTIWDDEPMLTITAPLTNLVEGTKPPGVFRLMRGGDPKYNFTAKLAVGGTATYGTDYPPFLTNVYFSCGVTAIDLSISPTNELIAESTESVTAAILPDPAYTILSPSNAALGIVDAGTNRTPMVTITSPTAGIVFLLGTNVNIILEANVFDDSDTNNPVTLTWTKERGPDSYTFSETNQANTTVSFTNAGIYVLRLTANDSRLQGFAEVTAVVGAVELLSTNSLHWAFDDGSGTTVLDSSGFGRDGTVVGTADWINNGAIAGALRLAGNDDHVRQTSGTNLLNGLKAFSISFWVQSANSNYSQGIFSANDADTNVTLSFASRLLASCSGQSNVVETTLRTSSGAARRVSAANVLTNGWQHLALTWSNGQPPAVYINGQLDQPLHHMVALNGYLTNCSEFIIGKGPFDTFSWNGWVDDLRAFSRALSDVEVGALSSLPPTNYGAVVNVGPDVTVQLINPFALGGMVEDDGKPIPPGMVNISWTNVSGPVPVLLTNIASLTNTIQFTEQGEYVFRLIADDGQVKVFDDLMVTVIVPTTVDVVAADAEAAELGPDTGQFTFMRNGDIDFDLTVWLTMSGIASNGVDFIMLTNVVTFTAGSNLVTFDVVPFLDYPIEGDEPITFTIVSNLAYSIGSGEATVTIKDSPYGEWSIEHFTLEELTDPTLSGAAADFDFDGLMNFAEYAANLDPKAPGLNGPIQATLELNANDSLNYIVVTYQRRLDPTDTAYEVAVSNDLLTWSTGSDYVEELSATDDGNDLTETVRARIKAPYTGLNNQFVTVRVWLEVTGP